jgi:magnesium transporter
MEGASPDEERILSDTFRFHPLAIEDCIQDVHHPKLDNYGDYAYLVVHGVRVGSEKRLHTLELDVFLGRRYLLTYHSEPSRSVNEIWERALRNAPFAGRGPALLLHAILDAQIEHYFPVLEAIEKQADVLEEQVFGDATPRTLEAILGLKRDVAQLKRIAGPQRDVLARIARGEVPVVPPEQTLYFRDLYDHLFRLADMADGFRDMLQGSQDAYLSAVSNRLNEVMKALTLISTILLPMTVVGGIYGMNFDHMPELHFTWGYPMALGMMGLSAAALVTWYRRKGWL